MKIGLVCPYNIAKGGGVQEVVKHLQLGLIKHGHQAYIITPKPHGFSGKLPKNTLLLGEARTIKSFQTTSQISISVDIREVDKLLSKHQFDVLHFHEPWVPILSRQMLSRSNSVNIATFHAKLPDHAFNRTIEKIITPYTKSVLKYLKALTAVSVAAEAYVKTLTKQPIQIIPNGIDLNKYLAKPKAPQRDKNTILFIGRLEKRKGVKYLISAFAKLTQSYPELKLLIAGDGPDRLKLESFVQARGIKNVKFLGFISDKRKVALLQRAALFCSPALHGESFGIVLIEAMASGCVVVAGDNPGYESVLKEDGRISLVNPKDTKEFVRRLEIMLQNKQLRKNWQAWAGREVKKYDYPKIVNAYLELYKKTLV